MPKEHLQCGDGFLTRLQAQSTPGEESRRSENVLALSATSSCKDRVNFRETSCRLRHHPGLPSHRWRLLSATRNQSRQRCPAPERARGSLSSSSSWFSPPSEVRLDSPDCRTSNPYNSGSVSRQPLVAVCCSRYKLLVDRQFSDVGSGETIEVIKAWCQPVRGARMKKMYASSRIAKIVEMMAPAMRSHVLVNCTSI